MYADILSIASITLLAMAGISWFRRMQAVRLTGIRPRVLTVMASAAVLGGGALMMGASGGAAVTAWISVGGGATFLLLNALSGQERKAPGVRVGGPVIDFSGTVDDGSSFELGSLRGKPFLLKFFRGHW